MDLTGTLVRLPCPKAGHPEARKTQRGHECVECEEAS